MRRPYNADPAPDPGRHSAFDKSPPLCYTGPVMLANTIRE
jgi:hypothetical protein